MLITSTQASPKLLSPPEVARRLGVKPQTVYAYVSRGLLRPDPASTHRNSLFAPDEVERAAVRARRPSRSGALEVVIETDVNILDIAAVSVIVREAGGTFTDLTGAPVGLKTKSVLASTQPKLKCVSCASAPMPI